MADESLVDVDHTDDGVAIVTLRRPKVNALSAELAAQIQAAALYLTDHPPGAVIITGGDRVFCAGAEISEFGGPDEARAVGERLNAAFNAVAAIPRAVIAEVAGFALGGGCELALACDFRIASEKAVFGQPEILLGVIPGAGGTQRLSRLIGPSRAKDLIFSGRQVNAVEALEMGLADRVINHDELRKHTLAMATEYASGAVVAQGMAKAAIDQGLDDSLNSGIALEAELFSQVFATDDAQIGVESFKANGPGQAKFTGN